MNNIFLIMLRSIRAKFTSIVTKLRRLTSTAVLRSKLLGQLQQGFSKLFSVKPRHSKDYYTIGRWMISKKLAFATVIVLGVACSFYIYTMIPFNFGAGGTSIHTYKYNALPLKFYSGYCRILDKQERLAYEGEVKGANCEGIGTLYDKSGNVVYKGSFAKSRFEGNGTSYYPDGTTQYIGSFSENLYHGKGRYYRPSGVVEYDGEYVQGERTGNGILYNGGGSKIYTGSFLKNSIVYEEMVGKSTSDVSDMYNGKVKVYSSDSEYCVSMAEIGALYVAKDGANTLDQNWVVERTLVLSNVCRAEGLELSGIMDVTAAFGQASYFGSTCITLGEAIALNLLEGVDAKQMDKVEVVGTTTYDEIYSVSDYDDTYEVYIYSYVRNGLLYTFYCAGSGIDNFVMYAIESA